jgi:hypothetical protein
MARNQVQLMLDTQQWETAGAGQKGFNPQAGFDALGLDASRMANVQVMQVAFRPERGAIIMLLQHPGYPEVEGFDEAPTYTLDDADSLYPAEVSTSTVTSDTDQGPLGEPATMGDSSGPTPPPTTTGTQMGATMPGMPATTEPVDPAAGVAPTDGGTDGT